LLSYSRNSLVSMEPEGSILFTTAHEASKMARTATLFTFILDVPGSNPGCSNDYSDLDFKNFSVPPHKSRYSYSTHVVLSITRRSVPARDAEPTFL
jgi:hypothetical protein